MMHKMATKKRKKPKFDRVEKMHLDYFSESILNS